MNCLHNSGILINQHPIFSEGGEHLFDAEKKDANSKKLSIRCDWHTIINKPHWYVLICNGIHINPLRINYFSNQDSKTLARILCPKVYIQLLCIQQIYQRSSGCKWSDEVSFPKLYTLWFKSLFQNTHLMIISLVKSSKKWLILKEQKKIAWKGKQRRRLDMIGLIKIIICSQPFRFLAFFDHHSKLIYFLIVFIKFYVLIVVYCLFKCVYWFLNC